MSEVPDLRADVCVVGAGPAGLSLARWMADAGLHVLLLEAGPADPPAGGVDVTSTTNVGIPYSPATTRSSGIGGSSLRWRVETPTGGGYVRLKELDPVDVDRTDGVTGTWPLSWGELRPWYRPARELLGLPTEPVEDGPVGPGTLQRRTYSFVHRDVFTRHLPEVLAQDPRVRVVSDCTVTEVVLGLGPDSRVRALRCSVEGQERTVEATTYVLAGGAIENARLLLASRGASASGVGNGHDLVGRHFMEHPHYVSGVVLPGPGGGPARTGARWDVVAGPRGVTQAKYALDAEVLRSEGLLNAAYKVKPYSKYGVLGFGHDGRLDQAVVDAFHAARYALRTRDPRQVSADEIRRLGAAAPALAGFGLRRLAGARPQSWHASPGTARPHHGYRVLVMGEQQPSPSSRLRLGAERDRFGVPRAELDWRLTSTDIDSMVRGHRLVADQLGRQVAARVVSTLGPEGVPHPAGGAHHMGTTRMSSSPRSGVVDRDCRVHGVPNLYVAGSSVFPSGGAANPTLTILALASRLAAHVVREHRAATVAG